MWLTWPSVNSMMMMMMQHDDSGSLCGFQRSVNPINTNPPVGTLAQVRGAALSALPGHDHCNGRCARRAVAIAPRRSSHRRVMTASSLVRGDANPKHMSFVYRICGLGCSVEEGRPAEDWLCRAPPRLKRFIVTHSYAFGFTTHSSGVCSASKPYGLVFVQSLIPNAINHFAA